MKYIILFLLIPFFGFSQGGTWPIKYGDSDPSGAPSAAGTRLYFNTATNTLFFWEPAPSSTWRKQPKAFDQVSGCAAPAYTPTARQSTFAVNSCTPPELYQYTGAAWECLNCVDGLNLTAGSGITILGTAPDITISADGDGNGIYGGSGTVADGTIATFGSNSLRFGTANSRNLSSAIGTKRDVDNYSLTGIYDDVDGQFAQLFSGKEGDQKTEYLVDYNGLSISSSSDNFTSTEAGFYSGSNGITIVNTANGLGAKYAAEYPTILTNNRSIPDVGLIKQLVSDSIGTISSDALGTGFVNGGGSGTIPDGTSATLATGGSFGTREVRMLFGVPSYIQSQGDNFPEFGFEDYDPDNDIASFFGYSSEQTGSFTFGATDFGTGASSGLSANPNSVGIGSSTINFTINSNSGSGAKITDGRTTKKGFEYGGDYSATIAANPRSIPDVGTVDLLKQTPVSYTNAAAPNNCIFYSTTLSKLAYKDPGGTVNPLY